MMDSVVYQAAEWRLRSSKDRQDPWGEITLFAVMTGPGGETFRVPGYWDGDRDWAFRLSAATPGTWTVRTECSDTADAGLHGQQTTLDVAPADTGNASPLLRHGPVRIDGKRFVHADGTNFHWLADTWWMLMSERVAWPDDFARLVSRRLDQGFTTAQVVVGFQPDTTPFDGRDANAGGSPWLEDYKSINPAYFAACDRRLAYMIAQGIMPVILGGWGYHMTFMGKERMIAHWRYLVARYAAWPVMWCLAGEAAMAYYLAEDREAEIARLITEWPDVTRAVRESDPWRRPITLHCRRTSWDDTAAPELLDFYMTQAGHLPNAPKVSLELLESGRSAYPDHIIINAEPPYEGHAGTNWEDTQRFSFWSSMLSGASGFTYGAAGVFQANDRDRPTGWRPDGGAFDAAYWDDAMLWPGAEQIAGGHALLREMGFERFEVHPEWASIVLRHGAEAYPVPPRAYAAGIPGECRMIYLALRWYHWDGPLVAHLEPGVRYKAAYIETNTLRRHELGVITGDANGEWKGPTLPHMFDWLLQLVRV